MNFDPVTPELTAHIWELLVRHGKNWRIQPNISGHTGPTFTMFSPYESALRADDRPRPLIPICQGSLPWQPINVGRKYECRLIPPALFTLTLENKLHDHYVDMCIKSGNDGTTSCKNLVNFCLVTPESRDDSAHLCIYVLVLAKNWPTHLYSRTAIQKCHGVLER